MITHKDLDVWKLAINLVTDVYKKTKQFPSDEKFGLTNQIRRAAVSVPSNIAEGSARNSNKEYIQFLYISLGSITELETQFIIAQNLEYISQDDFDSLTIQIETISKLLMGLIRYRKGKL